MANFSDDEIHYLRSQPLARIATVGPDGQPDVVPVGFEFDGEFIVIGGFAAASTRRHRNVRDGNDRIALVVDDLVSTDPWTPRYLRVYGRGEIVEGSRPHLKITPELSWSWNLAGRPLAGRPAEAPRRTDHR